MKAIVAVAWIHGDVASNTVARRVAIIVTWNESQSLWHEILSGECTPSRVNRSSFSSCPLSCVTREYARLYHQVCSTRNHSSLRRLKWRANRPPITAGCVWCERGTRYSNWGDPNILGRIYTYCRPTWRERGLPRIMHLASSLQLTALCVVSMSQGWNVAWIECRLNYRSLFYINEDNFLRGTEET